MKKCSEKTIFGEGTFLFFSPKMLHSSELGCSQTATSFSDIIINQISAIAEGVISGFGQFAHDPKFLNQTVQLFNQQKIPARFPDAVLLRRIESQKIDDIWNFPLNMTCENTVPLPWTVCEATRRNNGQGIHSYEYNIMRIIDFIGRNYVRLVLPQVDTTEVRDSVVTADSKFWMNDKRHIYLGAWHRDLVPRIVDKVSFYPRQNAHKLFEYTGYDIFVHNILFGNAAKRMNDLMAGEDEFELCYDPFRTHGSALGVASYLGVDNVAEYNTDQQGQYIFGVNAESDSQTRWSSMVGIDGFTDAWIHDTRMSGQQFRDIYRKNVWYEAPVARNYHVRHSIHSRRFIHSPKIIMFPLDILPFGYSTESSLPTSALAGDCGYISIDIHDDWFDRSFYLTRMSDIPVLFPVVNHQHFVPGDVVFSAPSSRTIGVNDISSQQPIRIAASLSAKSSKLINFTNNDNSNLNGEATLSDAALDHLEVDGAADKVTRYYIGWVNPNSIGRFGRLDYWNYLSGLNPARWGATDANGAPENDTIDSVLGAINNTNIVASEAVLNGFDPRQLESVVPNALRPGAAGFVTDSSINTANNIGYHDGTAGFGTMDIAGMGSSNYKGFGYGIQTLPKIHGNSSTRVVQNSNTVQYYNGSDGKPMIFKPSEVSAQWAQQYAQALSVKLLQVGFQTLPSIRQFLAKLPNIYITTEWSTDNVMPLGESPSKSFQINNDIFIQAIIFWFIPRELNGIESMRLYPHHLKNHEMPPIPGLRISNEQSQGTTIYDWHMMNEMTPHLMGCTNPLLENMGIISFTPKLAANKLPHAYYDTNISGWIGVNILDGDDAEAQYIGQYNVNNGTLRIISIGTNGVASVNLNLYRFMF